ncbi:MAG TPA: S28 family serine protease, partial [Fimbriimonadaceae bacterium]|nr:S28 family serine protease [Fimbriimonadaceae bacterium]
MHRSTSDRIRGLTPHGTKWGRLFSVLCFLILATSSLCQTPQELAAKFKALPHVLSVKTVGQSGRETFDITFQQPVDHRNPRGQKFGQHVFILHRDFAKPVILGTEGYAANRPSGGELTRILGEPNLITVEHRYFGRSMPNPIVWKQLTVKNAADDMHEVVMAFRRLYKGKWVSTGASKGGQTALYYKCYYPNDVDAVV